MTSPLEKLREYGYELEYMDRDAVRAVLKSERYFQALRNPNAFHMHPLNYLRGVAAEIERLGGRICEQSPARSIDVSGAEKRVKRPRTSSTGKTCSAIVAA